MSRAVRALALVATILGVVPLAACGGSGSGDAEALPDVAYSGTLVLDGGWKRDSARPSACYGVDSFEDAREGAALSLVPVGAEKPLIAQTTLARGTVKDHKCQFAFRFAPVARGIDGELSAGVATMEKKSFRTQFPHQITLYYTAPTPPSKSPVTRPETPSPTAGAPTFSSEQQQTLVDIIIGNSSYEEQVDFCVRFVSGMVSVADFVAQHPELGLDEETVTADLDDFCSTL